jgi:transglutaminase-like putative cysteine protease
MKRAQVPAQGASTAFGDYADSGLELLPALLRYRLHQTFTYDYDAPVHDLTHRLVVVPPSWHGDQRLVLGAVGVSDDDAQLTWETRLDGTRHAVVRLARVPARLAFTVDVVAERGHPTRLLPVDALGNPALVTPSRLTRPDAALRRLARDLGCGGDVLSTADRLCEEVQRRISYAPGVTGVRTTAAQSYELGAGVCQDQAHVMLALARELGIPSRYVSGHLIGQGGTHAWVEVLVQHGQGVRAVAFDPCHGRRADDRYLTIATGADYDEVRPTSGWFSGAANGRLVSERDLTVTPVARQWVMGP